MKDKLILLAVFAGAFVLGYWYFSGTTTPTDPLVTEPGPAVVEPATDYIGLSEAAAVARAAQLGELFRVVERDGELLMVTEDFRPGRINAVVSAGLVASYSVEGAGMDLPPEPAPQPPAQPFDAIIGLTEDEAAAFVADAGVPFRVGARDGELLALTMDYRPGRVTASIEGGVVVSYTVE